MRDKYINILIAQLSTANSILYYLTIYFLK